MAEPQRLPETLLDPMNGRARLAVWQPLREAPGAADRKGAAALTAHSLLLSIVLLLAPSLEWTLSLTIPGMLVLGLTGTLIGLVLVGGWSAVLSLMAPFAKPAESLAWLRNIAAMDREDYIRTMRQLGPERAQRDALDYNYSIAELCGKKYAHLQRSVECFRLAMFLWMTLVILGLVW